MKSFKEHINEETQVNEKAYNSQYIREGNDILKGLKNTGPEMSREFIESVGIVVQLEGMSRDEWEDVDAAFWDLTDSIDVDRNWYVGTATVKDLGKIAKFINLDFEYSSKKEVAEMGAIVVIYNISLMNKSAHKPIATTFKTLDELKAYVANYNGDFTEGKIKLSL